MRTDSSNLPWHRVITSYGHPARHLITRPIELLRVEEILGVDDKVALSETRYEFQTEHAIQINVTEASIRMTS